MKDELLHPDEALRLVLEAGREAFGAEGGRATELVPLAEALGRYLPRAVVATMDQPPFDKSAMDGFAVGLQPDDPRVEEAGREWRVAGTIAAGRAASLTSGSGAIKAEGSAAGAGGDTGPTDQVFRVMTGAPLPPGTGFVQRVEYTDMVDPSGATVVFTRPESSDNIIRRGENLRAGQTLIGPRRLGPADIGNLASSGIARVEAARRPIVGILSTGDELEAAGNPLGQASIYDSNGPQLSAQVESIGARALFYGIVRDEEEALRLALSRALGECDVVLLSGGVSMGDFDYVPRALEGLGVHRIFHKIAMRPGKPTWFGKRDDKAVFGLPGNPVSTFVNFEVFIAPHLAARMGIEWRPSVVSVPLGTPLARRATDRAEYLPVRLARETEGGPTLVLPLDYHGSSMLSVLAEAEGLVRLEIGVARREKGEMIDVRLLRP
ncbi:MAG: molybdopterin molybdotransferase MoeA [Treponema sp.]|nr:molybdopterin molybdotransferase MoeA [Treponema sp.]